MTDKKVLPVFVCLIVLSITAVLSGCVVLDRIASPDDTTAGTAQPAKSSSGFSSAGRSTAGFADPIAPDESPQPVRDLSEKSGEMTTENLRVTFRSHTPIFQTTFSPRFSSQGIRVDVVRGPLLINYISRPRQYDPRISFLVITVRDLDTGKVVAQEGYGEPFASKTEQQIIIYGTGPYHINLYGNQMDVNVGIYTGDSL